MASLASRTGGLAGVGASAGAIAVVVGGLAIFAAPALGRLLRRLDDERAARIREDERASMAAHLHDSVLQSLVLMQRTDDPRRMTTIARRQERELRAWLYGTTHAGDPTSLHVAIDALAVAIEADHDIRVEAVVVGDQPLDEASRALVAAVREAVVNAARHAGVDRVDVFVEADDTELTGFVRDTGQAASTRRPSPTTAAASASRSSGASTASAAPPCCTSHAGRRHRGRAARAEAPPVTVRVVLVDDHALFRAGVRAELVAARPTRVEIVGEAADVDGAVAVVRATRPDVVLLDVHMPGGGGQQVIAARARRPVTAAVPRAVGVGLGRGRHRRRARRRPRLRHQDDRRGRAAPTPSSGSTTATPCSRRGSPGSCSTRSPATSRPRPTPSSTC